MKIIEQILSRLNDGDVVVITTHYRQTVYESKHSNLFVEDPKNQGVYIRRGKRTEFVFPHYIKFGRYVQR